MTENTTPSENSTKKTRSDLMENSPWYVSLFISVLEKQGLPTILILALLYWGMFYGGPAAMQTAKDVWQWHKANYDKLSDENSEQAKATKIMADTQQVMTKNIDALTKNLEDDALLEKKLVDEQLPVLQEISHGIKEMGDRLESKLDTIHEAIKPGAGSIGSAPAKGGNGS